MGVEGDFEFCEFAVFVEEGLAGAHCNRAADELALVAGLVGDVAGDKNIGRLSLKDQRGVGDGCAAPPEFHGAGIA